MSDDTRFTMVASFGLPWEANICCDFLKAQGINAHMLNDHHNSMEPYLGIGEIVPIRVMVPTEDLAAAQRHLEELETAQLEDVPELQPED